MTDFILDPIIGDGTNQQETIIYQYAEYWQNLLYLNSTFMAEISDRADQCGYTQYIEKYLTYPPPQEPFPVLKDPFSTATYRCDMFDTVYEAAIEVNPCCESSIRDLA